MPAGEYHGRGPPGDSCVVVATLVAFFRLDRSLHSELPQGLGTVIEELLRRQAVATRRADDLMWLG